MPKRRQRESRYNDEQAMARWLGSDYAAEAARPVQDDWNTTEPEPLVRVRESAQDFVRRARGRPVTLAIGRRCLLSPQDKPQTRDIQSFTDRCRAKAEALQMKVHRTQTIHALRYTDQYAPDEAEDLLTRVEGTEEFAFTRGFSEHPVTITGSVDIERRGPLVSVNFLLDELADPSDGLFAEQALVRSLAQTGLAGDASDSAPLSVNLLGVQGSAAEEFLDAACQVLTKVDSSEVELGRLSLVPLYKPQRY